MQSIPFQSVSQVKIVGPPASKSWPSLCQNRVSPKPKSSSPKVKIIVSQSQNHHLPNHRTRPLNSSAPSQLPRLRLQAKSPTLPSNLLISHKPLTMQGLEVVLPFLNNVLNIIIDLTMNQCQRGAPDMDMLLVVVEEFVPGEKTVGGLLGCFFEFVQFDGLA